MGTSQGPPDLPGRSFLTSGQREYLASEPGSYEGEDARQFRYQIRRNIQSGLIDLQVFFFLSQQDFNLIAQPLRAWWGVESADIDSETEWDQQLSKDANIGKDMEEGITGFLAWYLWILGPEMLELQIEDAVRQIEESMNVEFDEITLDLSYTERPDEDGTD